VSCVSADRTSRFSGEALESWPLPLFQRVLPRHAEIILEINRRFLDQVRARFPGDDARVARMSLIDEHGDKRVRMAHLACVGSHTTNGVAQLHSELLKQTVLRDFKKRLGDSRQEFHARLDFEYSKMFDGVFYEVRQALKESLFRVDLQASFNAPLLAETFQLGEAASDMVMYSERLAVAQQPEHPSVAA